jgi:hypothetical protein
MNFTLYIDESGDFETQRGQWVLSGLLLSDNYENCEKYFNNKFKDLPKKLDVKSMKSFHLTEFRTNFGHKEAVEKAKITLSKLNKLPFDYHCLATINFSKLSLTNREKTYRLMLSDILALCETVISDDESITHLDLIVASRTIDGHLQTTVSNIKSEIVSSLPIALEVDLATKGMVDLIGKHINVRMDYANNSWGLICADFLANLNYHNKKTNEKQLLDELELNGKYSLFESFGSYEIRRANIAERDKNYVLSVVRWVAIIHLQPESFKTNDVIQRLLFKIFNSMGTSGPAIAFEAILDHLWRKYNKPSQYHKLVNILVFLETELLTFIKNTSSVRKDNYLFRLRNLILIALNHIGSTHDGLKYIKLQREQTALLASNPEYFNLILDFKLSEIEVHVNALNFKQSLYLSEELYELIQSYKDVWKLLLDNEDLCYFDDSRASIKSQMTLFRCNILIYNFREFTYDSKLTDMFNLIGDRLTNNFDKSRYRNYRILLLLKQVKLKSAVDLALNAYDVSLSNSFDFFWLLKAVNDALLDDIVLDIHQIRQIINEQLLLIDINEKGHPVDLVYRELALFEHQLNNKSFALKYIRRSKQLFDLENSEIAEWLKILIQIHEDYILNKKTDNSHYFKRITTNSLIDELFNSSMQKSFLFRVRLISPY